MKNTLVVFLLIACACVSGPTDMPVGEFSKSVDESVGCVGYNATQGNIDVNTENGTLSVDSNFSGIPGLFMNAIVSEQMEYVDDSEYTVSGEWRKPNDAQNEQVEINVQLVVDYTEYHAEVIFYLNPDSKYYSFVGTRFQDLEEPILLMGFFDNNDWKKFSISITHSISKKEHKIKSISVDGIFSPINREMGTVKKNYKNAFGVLLETTNRFTGCLPVNAFVGKSQWRNVVVERRSLP